MGLETQLVDGPSWVICYKYFSTTSGNSRSTSLRNDEKKNFYLIKESNQHQGQVV